MATVNADKIQVHGHCGCGKAQYTVTLTPPDAPECYLRGACHCTTCSRINGSPYIWTSHWVASTVKWVGATQPPPPAAAPDSSPDEVTPDYLASFLGDRLDTWESLAGRKWKLRCRHCGSPMGTWNRVTGRYVLQIRRSLLLSFTWYSTDVVTGQLFALANDTRAWTQVGRVS